MGLLLQSIKDFHLRFAERAVTLRIDKPYLYQYSSLMKVRTSSVIAWRHIHIYAGGEVRCHLRQRSQAKQRHMTKLRKIMKIRLLCLYAMDLH